MRSFLRQEGDSVQPQQGKIKHIPGSFIFTAPLSRDKKTYVKSQTHMGSLSRLSANTTKKTDV